MVNLASVSANLGANTPKLTGFCAVQHDKLKRFAMQTQVTPKHAIQNH